MAKAKAYTHMNAFEVSLAMRWRKEAQAMPPRQSVVISGLAPMVVEAWCCSTFATQSLKGVSRDPWGTSRTLYPGLHGATCDARAAWYIYLQAV